MLIPASQSHLSSLHFGQVARSLSDLELPEINFLLREAGWLPGESSVNGQRHLGPWAEVQLGMMERAGLPRRAKSQALQGMMMDDGMFGTWAQLEGFQRSWVMGCHGSWDGF